MLGLLNTVPPVVVTSPHPPAIKLLFLLLSNGSFATLVDCKYLIERISVEGLLYHWSPTHRLRTRSLAHSTRASVFRHSAENPWEGKESPFAFKFSLFPVTHPHQTRNELLRGGPLETHSREYPSPSPQHAVQEQER